jgi:hypothetical protein
MIVVLSRPRREATMDRVVDAIGGFIIGVFEWYFAHLRYTAWVTLVVVWAMWPERVNGLILGLFDRLIGRALIPLVSAFWENYAGAVFALLVAVAAFAAVARGFRKAVKK